MTLLKTIILSSAFLLSSMAFAGNQHARTQSTSNMANAPSHSNATSGEATCPNRLQGLLNDGQRLLPNQASDYASKALRQQGVRTQ